MDLKFVLANAMVVDPGSKIVIPCYNDKDAESIRVRLFRLRNLLPAGKHLISIKKRTEGNSPVIILERTGPPLEIALPDVVKDLTPPPDIRRLVKVAVEDGATLQNVLDMFSDMIDGDELFKLYSEESLNFKQLTEEVIDGR